MDNTTPVVREKRTNIWATIIIAVLAGLIGFFIGRGVVAGPAYDNNAAMDDNNSMDTDTNTDTNATPSPTPASGTMHDTALISVKDQEAGMHVVVSSAKFTSAGWIVVRDGGRILGAQWVPAGTATNVTVDLLHPTVAGQTYTIVLNSDNGDKRFDSKIDTALGLTGGSIEFTATAAMTK